MEMDLESGEEEGGKGYNDNDDNDDNDDDDDNVKDAESISDNDNQSSDESVESAAPNKRKTKSPPKQIKKISTRKKITVPAKTKKSGQPKSATAKESKEDVSKKTIPTPKSKPMTSTATSTSLKLKTTESARRRKVEDDIDNEQSDTSVLSDENYQQQCTLINMNEVFMLNAEKLLIDGPATIQAFHDQANLPNFKTHWKQIITKNALVPIRFRLNGMKAVLGYTQFECSTWPAIRGVTLSIRQIAKDFTACFSQATRTSNTTYDCNEKIRAYKFAYDFADAYVEEASITRFEEIITLYYPDRSDLTPERENKICKAFNK